MAQGTLAHCSIKLPEHLKFKNSAHSDVVIQTMLQSTHVDLASPPGWFSQAMFCPKSKIANAISIDDPPMWLAKLWRDSNFATPVYLRPPAAPAAANVERTGSGIGTLAEESADHTNLGPSVDGCPFNQIALAHGHLVLCRHRVNMIDKVNEIFKHTRLKEPEPPELSSKHASRRLPIKLTNMKRAP